MEKLIIHTEKIPDIPAFLQLCPFGALQVQDGRVVANAGCRFCRVCQNQGPPGAAEFVEVAPAPAVDKSAWQGIAVFAEWEGAAFHPVAFELLGKARQLAAPGQKVLAVVAGQDVQHAAEELLHYGADEVHAYSHTALAHFTQHGYTAVLQDFVTREKPASLLVGATVYGRQLAPRLAARLRCGLTADCTQLEMEHGTELVQIRPAFGGNIMAEIVSPNARPQMATVRYKVMNAPARSAAPTGRVVACTVPAAALQNRVQVLAVQPKPPEAFIEAADVLVVGGRGIKKAADLALLEDLARLLGGQVACTRPLAECGWLPAKRQIGLSGRTVRPRLLVACGVSGAIQFAAGMDKAETIVAINQDPAASIFRVAHYGLVGDLYDVLPQFIRLVREGKEAAV